MSSYVKTTNILHMESNWGDDFAVSVSPTHVDPEKAEYMIAIGEDVRFLLTELQEIVAFAKSEIERLSKGLRHD